MIKGNSSSAVRLCTLIAELGKGLQQSITEKKISNHIHQKFCETASKKVHVNFCDRKRLNKARVITTEEVIRLREARKCADAKKAAKTTARAKEKTNRIKS